MEMQKIVQIVPRFFPTSCGVGDYARLLGAEWQRQQGLHSSIVVADDNWPEVEQPEGMVVRRLMHPPHENWADLMKQPLVGAVLQYSGYGYARRGAPLWLLRTIKSFKRHLPRVRLCTMFHEVAASGPITTSAFWMRPLQLHVAKRLRVLSDVVLTNCEANAQRLEEGDFIRRKVDIQPVISNFGESGSTRPWSERVRRIVVFNSNFGGRAPEPGFWQELSAAIARVRSVGVMMIGPPVKVPAGLMFPVEQPGFLAAGEVASILQESAFGYVVHGPRLLGKSGIFAAFAAHGVVPLIPTELERLQDGLIGGLNYYAFKGNVAGAPDDACFEQIQQHVRAWYEPHSLPATARLYASLLDLDQPAEEVA